MKNLLFLIIVTVPIFTSGQFIDTIFYKGGSVTLCKIINIDKKKVLFDKEENNRAVRTFALLEQIDRYSYYKDPRVTPVEIVENITKESDTVQFEVVTSSLSVDVDSNNQAGDTIVHLYQQIQDLKIAQGNYKTLAGLAGGSLDKAGSSIYVGIALTFLSAGFSVLGIVLENKPGYNSKGLYYTGAALGVASLVSFVIAPGHLKAAGKALQKW